MIIHIIMENALSWKAKAEPKITGEIAAGSVFNLTAKIQFFIYY